MFFNLSIKVFYIEKPINGCFIMIKSIVFDFNGIFVEPIEKQIIKKICSVTSIGIWIAYSNYYLNLWKFQKGYMSPQEFWKKIFIGLTTEEYKNYVEAEYEKRFGKNFEVYAIAKQLSKKYDLYLLSNSNFLQGKSYRKQKLYEPFKKIFLSHEIHQMKPFPSIFNHFLSQTKLNANECLFIDDSTVNTTIAAALGFKTIVFQNHRALKHRLSELNVN